MTTKTASKGIWDWDLVKWILGLTLIYLAVLFIFNDFNEETVRRAIRVTARISPLLFCIAFMARSFHLFVRKSFSFWIMMNRRYWGISFAIVHLIHLFFLVLLQFTFHPVFTQAGFIEIGGGGLAYLFIVLMLLTSFPICSKYLSTKNWKRLHTIGSFWIWGLFINSIWGRILGLELYAYIPLGLLLLASFGLRMWAILKHRQKHA